MNEPKKHTLHDAVQFVRHAEPYLQGIVHLAVTGSCLYHGDSNHDMDVIVYPHSPNTIMGGDSLEYLAKLLAPIGVKIMAPFNPEYKERHVAIIEWRGLQIDLIFIGFKNQLASKFVENEKYYQPLEPMTPPWAMNPNWTVPQPAPMTATGIQMQQAQAQAHNLAQAGTPGLQAGGLVMGPGTLGNGNITLTAQGTNGH